MSTDKIKVAVRVRPFNRRELELLTPCVVEMDKQQTVLHQSTGLDKIDRTCMKEIVDESFFHLDSTPSINTEWSIRKTLYSCIPELDLSIVPNPVMCSKCVRMLLSVFEFKKHCLKSEIQINEYIQQVQHTGDLNLVEAARFHQPDIKTLNIQVKMENIECIESFYQQDIKDLQNLLHTEIKIDDFEITEDFKNEDFVYDTNVFHEASECTGSTESNMEDVLFNTFHDYNINYNLSAAEENSEAHSSNIAQNCLQEVIENQDLDYSKNFNKTNAYYQCYICGHKAESKLNLILHLKHHKSNFKKSKQHLRLQNSSKPNTRLHVVEKKFKCSVCEYKCMAKGALKQHMRTHTGEKPFSCSVCKYQCSQKGHIKRHMLIHTEEKPFSCSVCEYQCRHKTSLKLHTLIHTKENSLHTGEKLFSCSVCKYQTNYKSGLKRHMLIHTEEKPYSCSICRYRCRQKCNLTAHIQIHTGVKPFSCSVCEYRCGLKYYLKRHMQTHTRKSQLM